MRLLYATGRQLFPFIRGGDGTTAEQMLRGLRNAGIETLEMGMFDTTISVWKHRSQMVSEFKRREVAFQETQTELEYSLGGEKKLLAKSADFLSSLNSQIVTFRPDLVLTQMEMSDEVIRVARNCGIPAVLYVHDITEPNHKSLGTKGVEHVFYNSEFTKKQFSQYAELPSSVVYPFVDESLYGRVRCGERRFITMINPTPEKGREVLVECIRALPKLQFQVVEGWRGSRGVDEHPNLCITGFGADMSLVYSQSHLVIIPSQWKEPFCRVPVEAGIQGVPTIVSNVGGLPESVGSGGLLIDDYRDASEWIATLYQLSSNQGLIEQLGIKARVNSERFTSPDVLSRIVRMLKSTLS